MADVIHIAQRRSAPSLALVAEAPALAEKLDAQRECYPGWACVLIVAGLALGGWAMFAGLYALLAGI